MNTRVIASTAALAMLAGSLLPLGSVSRTPGPRLGPLADGGDGLPLSDASTCRGFVTQSLSASRVRVCDEVTVTTRAEAMCSACQDGLHVVFMLQLEPC